MSILGKKPFIHKVLSYLTLEQLNVLSVLINEPRNPNFVSLNGNRNIISQENVGVSFVSFELDSNIGKTHKGFLCYADNEHCGLFTYESNSKNMLCFKIDPVNKRYYQIYENLTSEELRRTLDDVLETFGEGHALIDVYEHLEGDIGVGVDFNETNTKVSVHLDLTNATANSVMTPKITNGNATDVEWTDTKTINGYPIIGSGNIATNKLEEVVLKKSQSGVLISEETFGNHTLVMFEIETSGAHFGSDFVLHPYNSSECLVGFNMYINGQSVIGFASLNSEGHIVININDSYIPTNINDVKCHAFEFGE